MSDISRLGAPNETVGLVRSRYQDARRAKQNLHSQWYLNFAYYLGEQLVELNNIGGILQAPPPAPSWRVRTTRNLIGGTVDRGVALASASQPTWEVLPATGDQKDRDAAKVTGHALDYIAYLVKLQSAQKLALKYAYLTGCGFLMPVWDASLRGGQGDFDLDVPSSFDIYPEPGAKSQKQAYWLIRAHSFHVEMARRRFNDPTIQPTHGFDEDPYTAQVLRALDNATTDPIPKKDQCLILEMFERQSDQFRQGRRVLITSDKQLDESDLDGGDFPIFQITRSTRPGSYWGRDIVKDLRDPQSQLNGIYSRLQEIVNLHASPKWIVPDTANVADDAITDEPGEIIRTSGTPGSDPHPIAPQQIPPWVFKILEIYQMDINRISDLNEGSRGRRPEGVNSGRAIAILQAMDNAILAETIQSEADALSGCGKRFIHLWKTFITEPRTIYYTGEQDKLEIRGFSASDIHANDVRVNVGSLQWQNAAVKADEVRQDYSAGIITRDEARKGLSYGIDASAAMDSPAKERARWESEQLLLGNPIPVLSWERDAAHLEQHAIDFEDNFYKATPQAQQIALQHFDAHVQQLAAKQPKEGVKTAAQPMPNMVPPAGAGQGQLGPALGKTGIEGNLRRIAAATP